MTDATAPGGGASDVSASDAGSADSVSTAPISREVVSPDPVSPDPVSKDFSGADRRGLRLLELVAVMDRLRSPGGCPWDAEQTHESLAPYAVEEAFELAEAIEGGDRGELADELGDVLLQVAFHARVAQEHPQEPFDIDDVAGRIIAKLQRRHPHVFADVHAPSPADVEANWEAIKAAEKPERTHPLDGVPAGLPPLERVAKVVSRLRRAGHEAALREAVRDLPDDPGSQIVAAAVASALEGGDPSAQVRHALRTIEARFA